MRRILTISTLLAGSLLLANCGQTPAQLAAQVSSIESEVQADANLVCGFIPTVATIAAFIPGVGTIAAGAASIAESICGAVAQAPPVSQSAKLRSARLGVNVTVGSVIVPGKPAPVVITGQFTR